MADGSDRSCRLCGGTALFPVIDLGETPIANALRDPEDRSHEPRYPLALIGCPTCSLVQLRDDLPADAIFDEEYSYLSSYSASFVEHSRIHAVELIDTHDLGPESFVVEVASNDGYLLRNFCEKGVRALGIEPAPKPAAVARDLGIETVEVFCGRDTACELVSEYGKADVVLANNVLAHVPDINDFFAGLAALLADDGVLEIENPHIRSLIDNNLFDTIYHEHYSYLSCTAVAELAVQNGLVLNDVTSFDDLHGGTLRWSLSRRPEQTEAALEFLAEEERVGVRRAEYYEQFAARAALAQESLRQALREMRSEGKQIAAYGCAAKGATLLNSSGIGTDLIEYVVDLNPEKQGKVMPGCRIPCRAPSELLTDKPDVVVILAWNFASEIVAQQRDFTALGGRFLVPLPEPTFVEA